MMEVLRLMNKEEREDYEERRKKKEENKKNGDERRRNLRGETKSGCIGYFQGSSKQSKQRVFEGSQKLPTVRMMNMSG